MQKHYKEKHLQATIYKIENVKREQNFLIKHLWKVIAFGIAFSFWAPFHGAGNHLTKSKSLLDSDEYNYTELVFTCAMTYIVLCLLFHFSSKYQDKRKLKKLSNLKKKLEEEIKELSS